MRAGPDGTVDGVPLGRAVRPHGRGVRVGRSLPSRMELILSAADPVVRRYSHDDLPKIRQTLIDVHADAYADVMDDEFNQRFPWFVDHWGGNTDFDCVIAYDGDEAVAFAYGAPSTPYREWWREHVDPAPEKSRTFSYSELAVRTT